MKQGRIALALLLWAAAPAWPGQLPSTGDLLERYSRGDFAAFTKPSTASDLDRFRQALQHDAESWLRKGDARTTRRRQLVVATIALEAAHASIGINWAQGRQLIDWAASLLRQGRPDDLERRWHLAALAVIQGAYDNELLLQQQKLAWPRFSDEPRFLLALAIALESSSWPDPDRAAPWEDDGELQRAFERDEVRRNARQRPDRELRDKATEYQRRSRMRQAIEALEDLSNAEIIRADALLRLGYLHLRLQRFEIAVEQFEEVLDTTSDPFLLYLAQFLTGRAHEQQGDRANAITAYRAALTNAPRAQSATLALASLLFLGDGRDEAAQLVDESVASPLAADPWRAYESGDFRFYHDRLSAIRELLR